MRDHTIIGIILIVVSVSLKVYARYFMKVPNRKVLCVYCRYYTNQKDDCNHESNIERTYSYLEEEITHKCKPEQLNRDNKCENYKWRIPTLFC